MLCAGSFAFDSGKFLQSQQKTGKTEIQKALDEAKEKLEQIEKSINSIDENHVLKESSETKIAFEIKDIEQFINTCVRSKVQTFISGVRGLWDTPYMFMSQKYFLKTPFIAILISSIIAFVAVWLGDFFLRSRIYRLLSSLRKQKANQFMMIWSVCVSVAVASVFYYLLSECLNAGLSFAEEVRPKIIPMITNTFFLYMPVYFYGLWATHLLSEIVFSSTIPKYAIIPMKKQEAIAVTFWINSSAILFFIGEIVYQMLSIIQISELSLVAFLDAAGIACGFCMLRAIAVIQISIKKGVSSGIFTQNSGRKIWIIKILILIFTALWVIDRAYFYILSWPAACTVFLIAAESPLQRGVRRFRVSYMWRNRRKSLSVAKFFLTKNTTRFILHYSIIALIVFSWVFYISKSPGIYRELKVLDWIPSIIDSAIFMNCFNSAIIMLVAMFTVSAGDKALWYYVEEKYSSGSNENNFLASRLKTLMAMLRTVLRVIVWTPMVTIIAGQFGFESLANIWTWIGFVGLGISFGFQHIMRDFIAGFFIILENNLLVGDDIEIEGRIGQLESISLRTIKIRAKDGGLVIIPFGTIGTIINRSRKYSYVVLSISIKYNEDIEKAQACIERAYASLKKSNTGKMVIAPFEFHGVNEVTSYSIIFQARIKTTPGHYDIVRRAYNRILKQMFDEAGIAVPESSHAVGRSQPSLTNTVL